ncbi:hypothetical protein K501DRAFT_219698 [Backusella circina FSU 941]|nr:hypothetical protein K501DRAFT_219698 [Backusella circina FSU 941]
MQDTLWCCQERIVPKKVWRVINYETCTLHDLSKFISKKGELLLIEILDFLVTIMRYKETNQMDAYHLGEAMGKVTLGPADCDPIIAEKAGHFLTRMIIEHSKTMHSERQQQLPLKLDSDLVWTQQQSRKTSPMSKSEAARAKAKSYNRIIRKIHKRNEDWLKTADVALYAMMEDCYESEPERCQEPYLSIFSHLEPSDAILSPILFRLVTAATKATEPVPQDPFGDSYLFGKRPCKSVESQISIAFDDFVPLLKQPTLMFDPMILDPHHGKPSSVSKSHMKIINSSISHMKLNLRKPKPPPLPHHHHAAVNSSQHSSSDFSTTTGSSHRAEDLLSYDEESSEFTDYHSKTSSQKQNQVKSMMKRVIKMGAVSPTKKPTNRELFISW